MIYIAASVTALLVANYVIPHLTKKVLFNRFKKRLIRKDSIYLTFDDGPEQENTNAILDVLKRYNVKATFFVVGKGIKKTPELLDRILSEGHAVGNHSFNHTHAWKTVPWTTLKDIKQGYEAIASNGISGLLWRPPYGKLNLLTLLYSVTRKWEFVYWTVDPKDYNCSNPEQLTRRLTEQVKSGDVVLLHDGRQSGGSSGKITVEGLNAFLNTTKFPASIFQPMPLPTASRRNIQNQNSLS